MGAPAWLHGGVDVGRPAKMRMKVTGRLHRLGLAVNGQARRVRTRLDGFSRRKALEQIERDQWGGKCVDASREPQAKPNVEDLRATR